MARCTLNHIFRLSLILQTQRIRDEGLIFADKSPGTGSNHYPLIQMPEIEIK